MYHFVKMCSEIAYFTLTLIELFIYAVKKWTLHSGGGRHIAQTVNYFMLFLGELYLFSFPG